MPKKKPATPRALPKMGGFGLPFAELAAAARHFLEQSKRSSEALNDSLVTHNVDGREIHIPSPSAIFSAHRDISATQVFAAMATEAAINTYGVIHFGHDEFERHFRFGSLEEILSKLLGDSLGKHIPGPIADQLASLNGKRNALVHSSPSEISFGHDGAMTRIEPRRTRRVDLSAAVESVEEMTVIVRWLRDIDYQAYPFLQEWPDSQIGLTLESDRTPAV